VLRFSGLVSVLVAVLMGLIAVGHDTPAGLAQEATPVAAGVVLPPDGEVDGLDLAAWSARSWQWFFSLPQDVNPYFDATGEICGYGQSGSVFFLSGAEGSVERICVVPQGVHVFVPLIGSECSTVEPPPFFGRDEAELRRCASEAVDHTESAVDMSTMALTVDGERIADLASYRAATPLFRLWLPQENLLGLEQTVAESVADGYQVMLSPLSLGEHEVVITVPGPQGEEPVALTYTLTVVSGSNAEAMGTPSATPSI
jgi:hypothetical protein